MNDLLKYNDFIGSIHYSSEDDLLYGKVIGIPDLVTYQGSTIQEIKQNFINSLDEYTALKKETGKTITKSCSGTFNVRLNPKTHLLALEASKKRGVTLNKFVSSAINHELQNN